MTCTVNGKNLSGSVPAVASKSMAHRLLICASLADAPSVIRCESLSDDITATASCMNSISAFVEYNNGEFHVTPRKRDGKMKIDCSESGSTLRFLLPVLLSLGVETEITMHGRLPQRPLSPLREELCRMGASIAPQGENPLSVGGKIRPGEYTLTAEISSQFISGLLFALPLLDADSRLVLTGKRESASYISMTISALALFGICIKPTENGYEIPGHQKYISPGRVTVEGDWSNAAFWLCAAFPDGNITVSGLSERSLQGDMAVVSILSAMKADGDIQLDCANIPDLVPALSVAACKRVGTTQFINAGRLRIKESDRIKTTISMLTALGGRACETPDGLIVHPSPLHPGTVDAAGDHRIAMAASAASRSAGDVTIIGAECAAKSYPAFFDDFAALGGTVCTEN